MTEETRKKMQAIFAQQLAKANAVKTPPDRTGEPIPQPKATTPPAPAKKDIGIDKDVKEYTSMADLTAAANNGEVVSIMNIINLQQQERQQKQTAAPEISTTTFADLLPDAKPISQTAFPYRQPTNFAGINIVKFKPEEQTPAPAPEPTAAADTEKIQMVEYSEKSFALIGKGTIKIKDQLPAMGGTYNRFLKCGAGWIFSNKRKDEVLKFLKAMAA